MSEKITIELPDELARSVRAVAARTQRSVDEVLLDWVRQGGGEPVLALLPDDELLAVCDSQMEPAAEEELSDLLDRNREGALDALGRERLEALMRHYRAGLVRKAQAVKVAVDRGLRSRMGR